MGMRDKEIINIKCDTCGAPISIKYGTYRKTIGKSHMCRRCRGIAEKMRIQNMSDYDRAEYLKRKNEAIRNGWRNQSDDMKSRISKLRSESWNNDIRRDAHTRMLKDRWNNLTDAEKIDKINKLGIGRDQFWMNPDNREYYSNLARERWYSQSEEDRIRILQALSDGRERFQENVTFAEKEEIARKRSESMHRYWLSLTPEQFQERINIFRERLKENFDKLDIIPNNNESEFIKYLDGCNIPYEFVWYNKIKHPDFDKLFAVNPVRPGKYVSPYHAWDFILFLKDGNVLVDIDGSVHDPKNSTTGVTMFNDSKRPYQTDGLPAYIVKCYDNNITDNTPVENITTGENMSFKSFMALILWMNMDDDEKKFVISC